VDALQRCHQLPHHLLHHQRAALQRAQPAQRAPEYERLQVGREATVVEVVGQSPVTLRNVGVRKSLNKTVY
jgi:hypothetical protein